VSDRDFYDVEALIVTALVVGYLLTVLVKGLSRSRPQLSIGWAVVAGLGLRVLAAAAVSLTSVGASLRGGDEPGFVLFAHRLADKPLSSPEWTDALTKLLHKFVFAAQFKILDGPEFALRVTQAGLAVAGLVLLAAAVYDLAGPRASALAAWLMALEPASIFFSGILHKEALMFLASGLVAYGGTVLWKRNRVMAVLPMIAGCLIAIATRPYAGWFLIAASATIALHASLRHSRSSAARSAAMLMGVIVLVAVTGPTVWNATSPSSLGSLQSSQTANATDQSNLRLERVDYSTRGDVFVNLPRRTRDVLVRPYPWQVDNTSQRFGVLGTLAALLALAFLGSLLWRRRGEILERAGPLVYLGGYLLVAYALSVGNAGTGFRYRTHIIAIVLCLIAILREPAPAPAPATEPAAPRPRPRVALPAEP
jgi:hypothetical protein